MSDDQAQKLAQELGAETIVVLNGLAQALSLYETNNAAIVRILDQLEGVVERLGELDEDTLRLQLLEEEFFVNGRLIRVDERLYERALSLARTLARFDLGEITLGPGVTREQLVSFADDLAKSVRGKQSALNPEGYGEIALGRSTGQSVASFRFDPKKLSVLLYGSLLDLVERLYVEVEQGRFPSLLPLKRSFQLIIDNMAEHGAIYQVLSAVRDPSRPVETSRLRVAVSVDVVGFGHYLGLPKTDLMYLALGGILGGLSDSPEPDVAVQPLYGFSGLGESAMPLILAVHDSRATRRGEPAGVPGRMLAVAEIYQELTSAAPDRPAMAPGRALKDMVEGRVEGVDRGAARVFMEYKGPYPLGSAVRLDDGGVAVVISQGEDNRAKRRPTVALLERDGSLGRELDLARERGRAVRETPDPAAVGLNLART